LYKNKKKKPPETKTQFRNQMDRKAMENHPIEYYAVVKME
jgi:hypothetical protein